MRNVKNTIADRLLSWLAPHPCSNCGAIGRPLCLDCKSDIIHVRSDGCVFCGITAKNGICSDHDLPYSALWVAGKRRGSLQIAIGAFKFRYMQAALVDLIDLLDGAVDVLPTDTVVVPVPTRPSHIRQRGYDHALLLAEAFAHRRGLGVERAVERIGTSVQHRLRRAQRIEAASRSFVAPGVLDATLPYLIIDDILTTGATVAAVATALRAAGARVVWVAVIAHQPLD